MNELTTTERSRLKHLENVIKFRARAFLETGVALAEIRNSRLYRAHYPSFEAYCSDVWGWTHRRVNYLIESAEAMKLLPPEKAAEVKSEAGARKAAKSLGNGKQISQITRQDDAAPTAQSAPQATVVELDSVGTAIPGALLADWSDAQAVGNAIRQVGKAFKIQLQMYLDMGDEFRRKHNLQPQTLETLTGLLYELKACIPYAVCVTCQGTKVRAGLSPTCDHCYGRGWVSKPYWDTFVPERMKK